MSNQLSVTALATRIMQRYDRNDDGVINLQGKDDAYFAKDMSEAVVAKRQLVYDTYETPYSRDISYRGYTEEKVSLSAFFQKADQNGDKKVDRDELKNAIRLFDTDGDGKITMDPRDHWSELNELKRAFPEKRTHEMKPLRFDYGTFVQQPGSHANSIVGSVYQVQQKCEK